GIFGLLRGNGWRFKDCRVGTSQKVGDAHAAIAAELSKYSVKVLKCLLIQRTSEVDACCGNHIFSPRLTTNRVRLGRIVMYCGYMCQVRQLSVDVDGEL